MIRRQRKRSYRINLIKVNGDAVAGSLKVQPGRPRHLSCGAVLVVVLALSVEHDLVRLAGAKGEDLVHYMQTLCLALPGL